MGNLTAMKKAEARKLIEFYLNSNSKYTLEFAKEEAKKYCDDMVSYYEQTELISAVSYWQGVKPEIENYGKQ
jgi:hypothetical protein